MLGDIGLPELLVIFVIVLVLFGPGKLPDVGKAIGEALRGFKKAMRADEESIEDKTGEKEKDRQQKNHA
jgi:sec-independent protein translocase protein TatA